MELVIGKVLLFTLAAIAYCGIGILSAGFAEMKVSEKNHANTNDGGRFMAVLLLWPVYWTVYLTIKFVKGPVKKVGNYLYYLGRGIAKKF